MENRTYKYASYTRRQEGGFLVDCKCPANNCGIIHKVWHKNKPSIMPRIYCPDHDYLRTMNSEGYGYEKFHKAGRPSAR